MLIGEYEIPLGEKGRIAVPKKLRNSLGDNLIITRGYERSLILLNLVNWQVLTSSLNTEPLLSMDLQDTKRYLVGGAFQVELDAQGRFVIPEALQSFAKLQTNVTIVGVGEWAEIWSTDLWAEKLANLANKAGEIANRLTNVTITK